MPESPLKRTKWAVRYGVPAGLAVIGLVILAVERSSTGLEGWGMFTGAAGAVLLLNQLYRVGARGDHERSDEESARDYYAAHGDWPAAAAGTSGRKWTLPAGVVTLEAEQEAARRAVGETASGEPPAAA